MFPKFPKIPRWDRDVIITEKIDGTNGLVAVMPPDQPASTISAKRYRVLGDGTVVAAGSRNRWLEPNDDNFGFAQWVWDRAEELAQLGPGRHYGEWYGRGIQRGYDLNDRRFMLFNVSRWHSLFQPPGEASKLPDCCEVATVLTTCGASELSFVVPETMLELGENGSRHVPDYPQPEGIVLYHTAGNHLYKVTFDTDGSMGDGFVIRSAGTRAPDPARNEGVEAIQRWLNRSVPVGVG